ncbi:MAG: 2-hydroxyacyl-CoA dehydratase [Candidatus Helarchaeota archaeon]|nr:2-hydroxyacyl-CoA dehydratase [Candidatus Helarchaeota archaeon]
MSNIDKFAQAIPLSNSWIDDWKKEGKKALGYFCCYIPEEIMFAADILPIRMRAIGMGCTDTPMGDAYMSATTCSFTRCCLELANRKQYNFLDGIVCGNTCDQIRRLFDNIKFKAPFPFHHFLSIPCFVNDVTLDWYKHELVKFKESLEKSFGVKITDDDLKRSIKTYNESRTLLKKLYMLRKRDDPPISGTDMLKVTIAGVTIPRDKYNELLTQLLKDLEGKKGNNPKARIMVVGAMLDDPEWVKLIEDLGGAVVIDSLCFGSRYFWDLVDEKGDPLEALAKRYLSKVPCPRMTDGHPERTKFVEDMIKEFNVDGVILQRMKFCPFHWGEIFMLRRELKEQDVPTLELEREYVLSGAGAIKTRIQAFLEVLEAR